MTELNINAPNFTLAGLDADGNERSYSLEELLSSDKQVILYFYPKDNTPGCTKEACDFRDNFNRISSRALVVGVSPDSVASHKKFREKQGINFILLSDPDKTVAKDLGAWGEKKMFGKTYEGIIRSTFIIAKDFSIKKSWKNVKVKGHLDKVIEELENL